MGTIYEDYEIWVVDDEEQVRTSVKDYLEIFGYQVQTFADPVRTEAELALCAKYILVILDHDFSNTEQPTYTGYDFSKKVKQDYFLARATPIIYLTGRETRANFDKYTAEFPSIVPNVFLQKNEIALDGTLLANTVAAGFKYLENLENSIEEHGLALALEIASDWRF